MPAHSRVCRRPRHLPQIRTPDAETERKRRLAARRYQVVRHRAAQERGAIDPARAPDPEVLQACSRSPRSSAPLVGPSARPPGFSNGALDLTPGSTIIVSFAPAAHVRCPTMAAWALQLLPRIPSWTAYMRQEPLPHSARTYLRRLSVTLKLLGNGPNVLRPRQCCEQEHSLSHTPTSPEPKRQSNLVGSWSRCHKARHATCLTANENRCIGLSREQVLDDFCQDTSANTLAPRRCNRKRRCILYPK